MGDLSKLKLALGQMEIVEGRPSVNERARDAGERAGLHMWCASKNLKKPKERTSDTKMTTRKVKMIATNFNQMAREIMERVYPGYSLEDCRVLFSDIVDGVYIRCVMRRRQ